jgi:hypothetical protein
MRPQSDGVSLKTSPLQDFRAFEHAAVTRVFTGSLAMAKVFHLLLGNFPENLFVNLK